MDYGYPERRKNKKDRQKKREFRAYKRGGQFRGMSVSNSQDSK